MLPVLRRRPRRLGLLAIGLALAGAAAVLGWTLLRPAAVQAPASLEWSAADVALLRTLSLDALPAQPADPSNAFVADPGAAALGQRLFSDRRLGASRQSCADCHRAELAFTDGQPTARGVSAGQRNTPTLLGVAFNRSFNWDGRIDTLWGQALGPLEHPDEMGSTRVEVVRLVAGDPALRAPFEQVFGALDAALVAPLPAVPCGPVGPAAHAPPGDTAAARCWRDLPAPQREAVSRVFVNVGKALAAYQAGLRPPASRLDGFVQALAAGETQVAAQRLSAAEQRGLRLFITPARTGCLNCHNGPMLSNGGFHDIGTSLGAQAAGELGHMLGARLLEVSEFRCDGRYSDALPEQCLHTRFQAEQEPGHGRSAFKVPTLRALAQTAPYMHDGRYADLRAVLQHYRAPPLPALAGAHELLPLQLTDAELDDLARFLGTLSAPP